MPPGSETPLQAWAPEPVLESVRQPAQHKNVAAPSFNKVFDDANEKIEIGASTTLKRTQESMASTVKRTQGDPKESTTSPKESMTRKLPKINKNECERNRGEIVLQAANNLLQLEALVQKCANSAVSDAERKLTQILKRILIQSHLVSAQSQQRRIDDLINSAELTVEQVNEVLWVNEILQLKAFSFFRESFLQELAKIVQDVERKSRVKIDAINYPAARSSAHETSAHSSLDSVPCATKNFSCPSLREIVLSGTDRRPMNTGAQSNSRKMEYSSFSQPRSGLGDAVKYKPNSEKRMEADSTLGACLVPHAPRGRPTSARCFSNVDRRGRAIVRPLLGKTQIDEAVIEISNALQSCQMLENVKRDKLRPGNAIREATFRKTSQV